MSLDSSFSNAVNFLYSRFKSQRRISGTDQLQNALKETKLTKNIFFQDLEKSPYKVIVVAGTNGKGSVCASLNHLLQHNSKKVGLFTSPHLVSLLERIQINSQNISEDDFLTLFSRYKPIIIKYDLSFFESLLIIAIDYFLENNVDNMILEVGLGGLYDATNFIPHKVSALTKIGLDHQDILGTNLNSILENKLGIVHGNDTFFHLPVPKECEDYFLKWKNNSNTKIFEALPLEHRVTRNAQDIPQWEISFNKSWYKTTLMGFRAVENLSLALEIFSRLCENDQIKTYEIDLNINWPGRMEKVESFSAANLFLSGDHNFQGIQSLNEILKYFDYERLFLVSGFSTQKAEDLPTLLEALKGLNPFKIYLTYFGDKSVSVKQLESYQSDTVSSVNSVQDALESLISISTVRDLILVTGSLYLVGEVKKYLLKKNI